MQAQRLGQVCCRVPDQATSRAQVPLVPPKEVAEAELKECTCWDWKGLARDEGEDAAAWLTDVLGKPCRLVRYVGEQRSHLLVVEVFWGFRLSVYTDIVWKQLVTWLCCTQGFLHLSRRTSCARCACNMTLVCAHACCSCCRCGTPGACTWRMHPNKLCRQGTAAGNLRCENLRAGNPAEGTLGADPKRRESELPFGKGVETAFADGYPFLLATEVPRSPQHPQEPCDEWMSHVAWPLPRQHSAAGRCATCSAGLQTRAGLRRPSDLALAMLY